MTPRATGEPPSAICRVPPGSSMSSIYSAEPCTFLTPLSCWSALCTWRSGASIAVSLGGMRRHPAIGNAGDVGRDAGNFGERLDDKVPGHATAIAGAGAQISKRREIFFHGVHGGLPAPRVAQRQPAQILFNGFRPLGNPGHSTERDLGVTDPSVVDGQAEHGQQGGNILVEAFGDLVSAEMGRRRQIRYQQPADEFALGAILLAVIEKEV